MSRLLSSILELALAVTALAQTPTPPQTQAADYSNEAFIIEKYHWKVRFEENGAGRRTTYAKFRVNSEAGVRALGVLQLGYNKANEDMVVDFVRVHKRDGSVLEASADNMQDLPQPIAQEAPIYTDFRQKHITVPGLRPGDVLEYQIVSRIDPPYIPNHFWQAYSFSDEAIVLEEMLQADVPASRKLTLKSKPDFEPTVEERDGRRIYTWRGANLKRPPEKKPDDEPDPEFEKKQQPSVQFSTFQSWEEVGRWYSALQGEKVLITPEVRAKAEELTAGLETEQEKARALYEFVAGEIRYVSLSFGIGRFQPHSAAEVFANRYGDCKDKHTLFAALLQAVGMEAYPVLIHSSVKLDPDVPSPAQFDHLISALPLGGSLTWADTTAEVAPFGALLAPLRKKSALLMPGKSAPRLEQTVADLPYTVFRTMEIDGAVSEDGKIEAAFEHTMRDDLEIMVRQWLRATPRVNWREFVQGLSFGLGFSGEVTDVTTSELDDLNTPLKLKYKYNRSDYITWTGLEGKLRLAMPDFRVPAAPKKETSAPIELGQTGQLTYRARIKLPSFQPGEPPHSIALARDYAEYRSTYKVENGYLISERVLTIKQREIPGSRRGDYAAFLRALSADGGQQLALTRESLRPGLSARKGGTEKEQEKGKEKDLEEETLLQMAEAALKSEDYSTAIVMFGEAVKKNPKHGTAWQGLGQAQLAAMKFNDAVESFRKHVAIEPFDERAHLMLAMALFNSGKKKQALEAIQKHVEVNPLDGMGQAMLVSLLAETGEHASAVEQLKPMVARDPGNVQLAMLLAHAYLQLKQPELAVPVLKEAWSRHPENDSVVHALGEAYLKAGEKTEAETLFRSAADDASAQALNNMAWALATSGGDLELAEELSRESIDDLYLELAEPHDKPLQGSRQVRTREANQSLLAAAWDTLGYIYMQAGKLDLAEKYLRAAWLLSHDPVIGDNLAELYLKKGLKQEAGSVYASHLTIHEPNPERKQKALKIFGTEAKLRQAIDKNVAVLQEKRTYRLQAKWPKSESSQVKLVIGSDGKVLEASFDESTMEPLAEAVRALKMQLEAPDDVPFLLRRQGLLWCGGASGCMLVLEPLNRVPPALASRLGN